MMNQMSIDSQKRGFELFFSQNRRIIFSAPYGAGKSYFLDEFFQKKEGWHNIVIHPLNYQICGNEDIFQLIQRDILVSLYAIDPKIIDNPSDKKLKTIIALAGTIIDSLDVNIPFACNLNPKQLVSAIAGLKKLYKSTKHIRFGASEVCGKYGSIAGELSEANPFSELICRYVDLLHNRGARISLTIDDYDRMDPGQIFRLFNVFSTCVYNNDDNANRFGLDRIILVCDIENIKRIYHHLYGEADFRSYISKFSPNPPFLYSISEQYPSYISSLLTDSYTSKYPIIVKSLAEEITNKCFDIRQFNTIIPQKRLYVDESVEVRFYPFSAMNPSINLNQQDFVRFVYICEQFGVDGAKLLTSLLQKEGRSKQREIGKEIYSLIGSLLLCVGKYVSFLGHEAHPSGKIYKLNIHLPDQAKNNNSSCNCIFNDSFEFINDMYYMDLPLDPLTGIIRDAYTLIALDFRSKITQ